MTREAQLLAQTLLNHHKTVCRSRAQTLSIESCLIPYGDLCESAGMPHLKNTVGKFLREIAEWCSEKGWPPLNALAVNHATGMPGRGYDDAPGCSLDHWREQVTACVYFLDYPETVS